MAPVEVNPSNSQGGGNKGPPPKKQAQLGFSQGKAGLALKASEKKQRLSMPGQGEMRAGVEDNEKGAVPAPGTWIRARSLPLPGGEAASLHHVDGQKLALACMKGKMP